MSAQFEKTILVTEIGYEIWTSRQVNSTLTSTLYIINNNLQLQNNNGHKQKRIIHM